MTLDSRTLGSYIDPMMIAEGNSAKNLRVYTWTVIVQRDVDGLWVDVTTPQHFLSREGTGATLDRVTRALPAIPGATWRILLWSGTDTSRPYTISRRVTDGTTIDREGLK